LQGRSISPENSRIRLAKGLEKRISGNTLWWRASVFGCGKGEIPRKAASRRVLGAPPLSYSKERGFRAVSALPLRREPREPGATPRPPVSRMCGRWAAAFGIRLT
jgi:hypothetical protein